MKTCKEDRPLVIQINGDNPERMLVAGRMLSKHADAIDINFGCP
jgi:tRNA-dihydrouridine synthase 1